MKHLLNQTVYGSLTDIPGEGTPAERLAAMGADGVEMLTDYVPPSAQIRDLTEGVHLPYATDWMSAWNGRVDVPPDASENWVRFTYYGRDRDEVIRNLYHALHRPRRVDPDYGVLHACNARIEELGLWKFSDSDSAVLKDFAEMLNSVVAQNPGGEPPFTIMLENLWFPGLRLLDGSGWKYLESKLEFEDWGICFDSGHLLIAAGGVRNEDEAIEKLWSIVEKYPRGLKDRLSVVHLHVNYSKDYLTEDHRPEGFDSMSVTEKLNEGYKIICGADKHLPFTDRRIEDIVEFLYPEHVTHELLELDPVETETKFRTQRSLFRRS